MGKITGIEIDGKMYDAKPAELFCKGCHFRHIKDSPACAACNHDLIFIKRETKGAK